MACEYIYNNKTFSKEEFYKFVEDNLITKKEVSKYNTILFPSGDTAARVEGHETLEDFRKQKQDEINKIQIQLDFLKNESEIIEDPDGFSYTLNKNKDAIGTYDTEEQAIIDKNDTIDKKERYIKQLQKELKRVETEGFGALKPIHNFYENRVKNTLDKIYGKENVKRITDEYGNQWFQLDLQNEIIKNQKILLSKQASPIENEAYKILKAQIFQGKTEISTIDILKNLSNKAKSPYIKKLADILGRYAHNNVPVKLMSLEEATKYIADNGIKLYEGKTPEGIAGFYDSKNNTIIIVDRANKAIEAVIEHEIIHALTHHFLHSDDVFAKEFNKLFKDSKALFSEEEQKSYYFTNVDEFLTGILTDSEFQKLLSTKPAEKKSYASKWEEIKSVIKGLLTKHLGLDLSEYTLLDKAFESALDVIEASAEESEINLTPTENMWEEYALSALSLDDREEIKEDTKDFTNEINNIFSKEQVRGITAWFNKKFEANYKSLLKDREFKEQRDLYTDEITSLNTYTELSRRLASAENKNLEEEYNEKVRALAEAVSTTIKLVDISYKRIQEIAVDKSKAKENIITLNNYLKLLNTYRDTLERVNNLGNDSPHAMFVKIQNSLDKINKAEKFVIRNDETGIIQLLKENSLTTSGRAMSYYKELIEKQKEILAKAEKLGNTAKAKIARENIKQFEEHVKKYDLQNENILSNWLRGKYGDQNRWSMFLDSYRDATDPIIGTFVNYVNRIKEQVKQYVTTQRTQMDRELNKYYDVLGYGKGDVERLWGQLTHEDERLNSDGTKHKILSLLSPYKNYQYDRDVFLKDINSLRKLKEDGVTIDKSSMPKELLDKVEKLEQDIKDNINKEKNIKEWEKITTPYNVQESLKAKYLEYGLWQSKYMVRDKTDIYYNTYDKLYNDEIGASLKHERDAIFEKLNRYNSLQGEGLLDEDIKSEMEDLWDQYYALSNLYKIDGTQKEGKELAIAKRAQQISEANRIHYEYKINTKAFDRNKKDVSDKLISQYGEDSEEYQNKMKEWEENNTRTSIKQEYYEQRKKLSDELNTLMKAVPNAELKDKDLGKLYEELIGQVYGFRDESGQPIGNEIGEEKSKKIKELQEKIEEEKKKFSLFSGLNDVESARFNELYEKKAKGLSTEEWNEFQELKSKRKDSAIPKVISDRIISLFEQLKNMSSRIPTSYYVNAFNAASDIKIDEQGKIEGVDVLESPILQELLNSPTFKSWFLKNHFKTEKYNPATKENDEIWNRTYQWSLVVPSDPNMMEILPSRTYSYRVIKPEYKTKEIVGITTDNKGNFLPKRDVKDQKYINQDYVNLENSTDAKDKALFNILEIAKKYHLENQELSSNYKDRMYLDVPRIRKETVERNIVALKDPIGFVTNIPERIKSKYQSLEEFASGTGNPEKEEAYKESEDYYDANFDILETKLSDKRSTIPIAYMGNMDVEDVSRDVRRAILSYGGSLKTASVLKDALKYGEALRGILARNPIRDEKNKRFWQSSNVRLDSLEFFINREFFSAGKRYEIGEFGDRVVTGIKSLAVIKFLGSNINSIITNLTDGLTSNIINAGHGRYSHADYLKSYTIFSEMTGNAFKDYFNSELGQYSVSTLLLEAMEPVSEEHLEEGLTKGKSKLKWALSMDWLTGNRAKTEYYIQARVYAAYLYSTKIQQGDKTINLSEAFEKGPDGVLKLKDGIDKTWEPFTGQKFFEFKQDVQKSVRDSQGAYAKADKTYADQFTTFQFAITLKRFFLRKFLNEFGAASSSFSLQQGLTFKPRYNPQSGTDIGFIPSMINGLSRAVFQNSGDFSAMTPAEKADTLRFLKQLGAITALGLLATAMYGAGSQRDRAKAIDDMSEAEAYLLYQILRLQNETETLLSPGQYYSFISSLTALSIYQDWKQLFEDVISQDEYKRDTGIYKRGDKKWVRDVEQLTGVYSILKLGDTKTMAKNYDKALNSKAKN